MALPKLNALPQYECVLPSTKKPIKYRPFLVKEQKLLLIAMETQDVASINNAVFDIISACIESDVSLNTLTMYDIEYLFTQIRAKSVGETIELGVKCDKCEESTPVQLDLEKAYVPDFDSSEATIEIAPDISLKLVHPNYEKINHIQTGKSQTETLIALIIATITNVMTEDENITFADEPYKERIDFIDGLTSQQLATIMEFVSTIPTLSYDLNWSCQACDTENTRALRGLADFF